MSRPQRRSRPTLLHRLLVVVGACAITLAFFMVLPLMQKIGAPAGPDTRLSPAPVAVAPPPPPPEEEPPEPEEEEQPPELAEAPPLNLSDLEVALNPGGAGMGLGGGFAPQIDARELMGGVEDLLAGLGDLDQRPRVVYQPGPMLDDRLRRLAPATVYVIFIVDKNGRVADARVQNPTHPALNRAALNAVRQWRFEPGMKAGEAVRFRMRVPVTFPEG